MQLLCPLNPPGTMRRKTTPTMTMTMTMTMTVTASGSRSPQAWTTESPFLERASSSHHCKSFKSILFLSFICFVTALAFCCLSSSVSFPLHRLLLPGSLCTEPSPCTLTFAFYGQRMARAPFRDETSLIKKCTPNSTSPRLHYALYKVQQKVKSKSRSFN